MREDGGILTCLYRSGDLTILEIKSKIVKVFSSFETLVGVHSWCRVLKVKVVALSSSGLRLWWEPALVWSSPALECGLLSLRLACRGERGVDWVSVVGSRKPIVWGLVTSRERGSPSCDWWFVYRRTMVGL